MDSKNENSSRIDYGIVLCIRLLAMIGLVSLYSTSVLMQDGSIRTTLMRLLWYVLGIGAAAVILLYDSKRLWKITSYLYWVGIIALVATLFLYDRCLAASTGAKSLISIPIINFTLQPSEFAKIPYILILAKVVTLHNSKNVNRTVKSDFILLGRLLLYSLLPFALLMAQND